MGETLMSWASKLEALGYIVSHLGYQAKNNGSQALEWYGEELGSIIVDYAAAVKKHVAEAYPIIKAHFEKQ